MIKKGYGLADLKTGDPITPATNFRMASVSKQFTAMSIMQLAAQQKISLEDGISQYFISLPPVLQSITIHQLLTHTSGIWNYETLIPADQKEQVTDEDVLRFIRLKDETYFNPGTKFRYSNTGYCLLALLVQEISGSRYSDFVRENIFFPLQMKQSKVYEKDKPVLRRAYGYHHEKEQYYFADQNITSATRGDGGVYTSLQDYLKWNEALSNATLLSREMMVDIFTSHVAVKDGISYGYGWFTGKEKDGTICVFHPGESTGFRNMVYYNPEKRFLIVIFSNRDDDTISKAFDEIAKQTNVQIAFSSENKLSPFSWLSETYGA